MNVKKIYWLLFILLTVIVFHQNKIMSGSVDLAHHYLLANKIFFDGLISGGYQDSIHFMSLYPPISHYLAALLAKWNGSVLLSMNILILIAFCIVLYIILNFLFKNGFVGFILFIIFYVAISLSNRPFPLIGYEIIGNYFYSQYISLAISLLFFVYILNLDKNASILVLSVGFTLIGIMIHPLPVLVVSGAIIIKVIYDKILEYKNFKNVFFLIIYTVIMSFIVIFHPYSRNIKSIADNNGWLTFTLITKGPTDVNVFAVILIISSLFFSLFTIVKLLKNKEDEVVVDKNKLFVSAVLSSSSGLSCIQLFLLVIDKTNPYAVKKYLFIVFTFLIASICMEISGYFSKKINFSYMGFINSKKDLIIAFCVILLSFIVFRNEWLSVGKIEKYQHAAKNYMINNIDSDKLHHTIAKFDLPPVINYMISIADLEFPMGGPGSRGVAFSILQDKIVNNTDYPLFFLLEDSSNTDSRFIPVTCLNGDDYFKPEIYRDNLKIYFNNINNRRYLKYGFSITETWGVWSDGDKSLLEFDLKSINKTKLMLEVQPFFAGSHTRLSIDVYVNEIFFQKWSFDKNEKYPTFRDIELPKINNKLYKIKFVYNNSISPAELGVSTDERKLGLGLLSIIFKD